MKAGFFNRLFAYMIDVIVINMIFSIVTVGVSTQRIEDLTMELNSVSEAYVLGEIDESEYMDKSIDLTYKIEEASISRNSIYVVLVIGYFVMFQYFNRGATIGKKLARIRIVENGKEPSLKAIFLRSVFINGILANVLNIVLIYVLDKNNYFWAYTAVTSVIGLFIFISAIMILYKKDRRGLHDMIARTDVVMEGK